MAIHQIKTKMASNLRNVTLVVSAVDGNVIGEVQLCLGGVIPKHAEFLDHFLYEIRRIWETEEDGVCDFGQWSRRTKTLGKVIQKLYFYVIRLKNKE